jgi:hypothetical protein
MEIGHVDIAVIELDHDLASVESSSSRCLKLIHLQAVLIISHKLHKSFKIHFPSPVRFKI